MAKLFPKIPIYGGDERIHMTKQVKDGDVIDMAEGVTIKVFSSPCHTRGHVLYYVEGDETNVVFTGDTLFVGGCGRFFEGDGAQMHHALNVVIAGLPDNTLIYCGHEYTLANLDFAASVDPKNEHVKKKLEWAQERRNQGQFTIPSLLSEEKLYNPFMSIPTASENPEKAMSSLREQKNNFKSKY